MKIAFCDDDQDFTALLKSYAKSWSQTNGIDLEAVRYHGSEEFLMSWSSPTMFDIIFLDIKMKKLSGLELAKVIRSINAEVPIVFITGYSEFALDGYSVDATRYLLKPVSEETFFECLDRLAKMTTDNRKSFFIRKNDQIIKLHYSEIFYFESRSHTITAYTTRGNISYRYRLVDIENELRPEDGFVKIHRSFIVNIKKVRVMNKTNVIMENGADLPISRSYSREAYNEYIRHNS